MAVGPVAARACTSAGPASNKNAARATGAITPVIARTCIALLLRRFSRRISNAEEAEDRVPCDFSPQKPTKRAASSTLLRSETTALAGKLSSGQPMAMAFMIT